MFGCAYELRSPVTEFASILIQHVVGYIGKISLLMLRRSSRKTSELHQNYRSAATPFTGTLKHMRAMSDSFGNWVEALNQNSAACAVCLSPSTADKSRLYAHSSVLDCMNECRPQIMECSHRQSSRVFSSFALAATSNTRYMVLMSLHNDRRLIKWLMNSR